jgi:hypothetical protein
MLLCDRLTLAPRRKSSPQATGGVHESSFREDGATAIFGQMTRRRLRVDDMRESETPALQQPHAGVPMPRTRER